MDTHVSQSRFVARRRATVTSTHELLLTPTSLWSHSLGGLAGRYGGHYKDVRLVDPWSGQIPRFRTQWHADSWLLRAFDPNCASYTHAPEPLHTLVKGRLIKAKPSGSGKFASGERFVDVVVRENSATDEELWTAVRASAACRGLTAHRREAGQLRENTALLDNLEGMRSHLVRHVAVARTAAAHSSTIVSEVRRRGACCWREVLASTGERCAPEVAEFALFCAYRRGELAIDVHARAFGAASQLSAIRREAAR